MNVCIINIIKPNHSTAYAMAGLLLATLIAISAGVLPFKDLKVLPGIAVATITLYLSSTYLGYLLKNHVASKGIILNLFLAQCVVFVSLTLSIVVSGIINATISFYYFNYEQAQALERLGREMGFDPSGAPPFQENIYFYSYITHPLVNILLVGALPAFVLGALLAITNMRYK